MWMIKQYIVFVIFKALHIVSSLQTADANLHIEWTVRWTLLTPTPAQRFTLMLWSTVRRLERLLNKPQPEPYVYVIENSEVRICFIIFLLSTVCFLLPFVSYNIYSYLSNQFAINAIRYFDAQGYSLLIPAIPTVALP